MSARSHVKYLDRAYPRVLSMVPAMYQDIWTAAKGMYKLEPVVADGGELVLYAPHVKDFSEMHGDLLAEIGYHTRDYFTGQWDRFGHFPGGVLAHSTHLRGGGSWDAATGEHPRITVILATGISPERCAEHNVGYLDPADHRPRGVGEGPRHPRRAQGRRGAAPACVSRPDGRCGVGCGRPPAGETHGQPVAFGASSRTVPAPRGRAGRRTTTAAACATARRRRVARRIDGVLVPDGPHGHDSAGPVGNRRRRPVRGAVGDDGRELRRGRR